MKTCSINTCRDRWPYDFMGTGKIRTNRIPRSPYPVTTMHGILRLHVAQGYYILTGDDVQVPWLLVDKLPKCVDNTGNHVNLPRNPLLGLVAHPPVQEFPASAVSMTRSDYREHMEGDDLPPWLEFIRHRARYPQTDGPVTFPQQQPIHTSAINCQIRLATGAHSSCRVTNSTPWVDGNGDASASESPEPSDHESDAISEPPSHSVSDFLPTSVVDGKTVISNEWIDEF